MTGVQTCALPISLDIGCDVAHIDSCNFGDFLVSLALEAVVKEDLPHGFGHFVDLAFDDGFYFRCKGCLRIGAFQNGDFSFDAAVSRRMYLLLDFESVFLVAQPFKTAMFHGS